MIQKILQNLHQSKMCIVTQVAYPFELITDIYKQLTRQYYRHLKIFFSKNKGRQKNKLNLKLTKYDPTISTLLTQTIISRMHLNATLCLIISCSCES